MDYADLTSLGFEYPDWPSLMKALDPAKLRGYEGRLGFRFLGAYTDPSGARLILTYTDADGTQTASDLVSDVSVAAGVTPVDKLAVRLDVLADPADAESVVTAYLAMLDDAFVLSERVVVRDLKVGAVALAARVYPSLDAFEASPDSYLDPAEHGQEPRRETTENGREITVPLRVSVPFLVSYALLKEVADRGVSSPVARVTGRIASVEERRNDLTGQRWWYVRVDSALPLAVALPGALDPAEGGVVAGDFWMVASTGAWDLQP
ncbi:hypothetical protein [Nigerium massiliense]|uniref:hypothetical protein n=1 Tax=Nigerium massiliense TaxID=1522317 RepID=UPI0005912ACC|nr:hypothetical protein [Nigerium massiliense]